MAIAWGLDEDDGGTVDVEVQTSDGRTVIYEVRRLSKPACRNDHSNPERAGDCNCADWASSEEAAHERAMKANPDCERCQAGVGTILPGPAHSKVHPGHCACDRCY